MKPTIPISYLVECFDYNRGDGTIRWKERPLAHFKNEHGKNIFNGKYAGSRAGNDDGRGYKRVSLHGKKAYVHRIIWALETGAWPPSEIDHIDHDPSNNRISNLRQVDSSGNKKNASRRRDNTTGCANVYRLRDKWRAQIYLNGRHTHLGVFDRKEDAETAAILARKSNGFHQNHGQIL